MTGTTNWRFVVGLGESDEAVAAAKEASDAKLAGTAEGQRVERGAHANANEA